MQGSCIMRSNMRVRAQNSTNDPLGTQQQVGAQHVACYKEHLTPAGPE
jgi:hypothetical protein